MKWKVKYSAEAKQDLEGIYDYISSVLSEPQIAKGQVERILSSVKKLDSMPQRYRLCDYEKWSKQGVRFLTVDNYIVFYLPDEADKSVSVVRIMYGGRDINSILN